MKHSNPLSLFEPSPNPYGLGKLFYKKCSSNKILAQQSLEPFGRIILVWQTFLRKSQAIVGCLNGRQTLGIIQSLFVLFLLSSCAPLIDNPPVPTNYSPQNTTPVEAIQNTTNSTPPPPPQLPILLPVNDLGVYILDMNGSSVITLGGKSILINANADTTELIKILKNLGIRNLDYLILTNNQDKNIIGASPIILRMKPLNLIHSGQASISPFYSQYTLLFDNETIVPIDISFKFQDSIISLIVPYDDGQALTGDNSILVKLSYGNFNVLFSSDCAIDCESRISNIKSNVIVSNGGCNSLNYIFLMDTSPDYVVFTGTPCQETYDRVNQLAIPILRTSTDGDVVFNSDGISYNYKNQKR